MCVRNSHMVSLLMLALLSLVTGVFAQRTVNCVPYDDLSDNDKKLCKYYRVSDGSAKSPSSALPKLCATDDKNIIGCPDGHRVPGAEFDVYAPQAGEKGLHIQLKESSDELENGEHVTAGSDGYLALRTYSYYPYNNVHLGVKTTEMEYPNVIFVFNFYVPEVKYFVDGEEVTSSSQFAPEVGDTLEVTAKLFVPEGFGPAYNDQVKGGDVDTLVSSPFYFDTPGESANLKFFDTAGKPLLEENGRVRLDFNKGVAVFWIMATKAKTDDSHFSLVGFPNKVDPSDEKYGEYFSGDPFPGDLQFTDRDLPSVKNAAIYDHDGDGIGDSIRVWLSGNTASVTLDSFEYSWPTDSKFKGYGGRVSDNSAKDLYILPDVKTTLQDPEDAAGAIKAVACTSLGGKRCAPTKGSLKDSIGAVIQNITFKEGNPESATDTLIIRFNKIIDTTWTQGQGLLHQSSSKELSAIDVEAISKEKNVWTFTVEADLVSVGDSIKINTNCKSEKCPDGIITAADGVPTAANNQKVRVDNFGRIYANENSAFFDRDGDGRMDSVSLGFDSPITREQLNDNMVITFYWLNEKGKVIAIEPKSEDLDLSADGSVVGYALSDKVLDQLDIKKMLTDIDPDYMKSGKYGHAVIENTVKEDGEEKVEKIELDLHDSMPPVIAKTFLKPESFQYMEADKFTISFTEPVDTKAFELTDDCLSFLVDGVWMNYSLVNPEWSEGNRKLTVRMESGIKLSERMNPADSVRFDNFTSGICDKQGNKVSEKSPAVMVEGDPRVITETASFADLNLAEELSNRKAAFNCDTISKFDPKDMSSLGVLLDVSFATIMKKDTAGGMEPDLKKIGLEYELDVYTNLGGYVGGASDKISCDDEYFFDGNCLEHPEKLYVRWNMRADNGRKVGVGVYLAQFKVKVFGAQSDFKIERIYRWGITSVRH